VPQTGFGAKRVNDLSTIFVSAGDVWRKKKTLIPTFSRRREKVGMRLAFFPLSRLRERAG
jgi:hypothetical protein